MDSDSPTTTNTFSNEDFVSSILQSKDDLQGLTTNWAMNELTFELAYTEPERAWFVVLELLRHSLTDELLAVVAAGPLENLLSAHGDAFIERVETLAKTDDTFRRVLSWVWGWTRISTSIYNRIRSAAEG